MRRLIVSSLLLYASLTFAGWQKIAQLDQKATCCFFLDDNNGLAGSGDYNGTDILKIWRTFDGGVTWLPCNVPLGVGQVTSIFMKDAMIGYASIFSQSNPNYSLWKTTDGGYSWFDHSKGNGGYTAGVWATSRALIKTSWSGAPGGSVPGGFSLNDGSTFTSRFFKAGSENSNAIYFTSDSIGIATSGPTTGTSWYTTNRGMNWTEGGTLGETWSAWGYEGTNVFFAVAELQRELYWSTNGGRSWARRYNFGSLLQNNAITTGHISGKGRVIYVQTYAGGFLRTGANDSGATWRVVGGPQNIIDSRAFYVGGCAGELVIAFGDDGSVWKTTDGGDGTLGTTEFLSVEHINFKTISACSTLSHFGTIGFADCGEFVITSAAIENDPAGVFTLLPMTFPDTLTAGSIDTFYVNFDPKGNPATYTARIRVKGVLNKLGKLTSIDSLIRISALATPVAPELTVSLNIISFPELSVCEPSRDTLVTLKNEGCDTLIITNGPSATNTPFTVQSLPVGLVLPPDSIVTFRITFKPDIEGSFNAATRIQATSQGRQQEIEILLAGNGRAGEGILSMPRSTYRFKTISICATDTVIGFMTNSGCDTLIVDSALISGDTDFSLATSIATGTKLRPGDTIWFVIRLNPMQKGARSGLLSVTLHNEHGSFPPSIGNITLNGSVVDGTKAIAQSLAVIDFGISDLCTESDSTFTLHNTGCDTVTVTGLDLIGSGFVLSGFALPILLAPDESKEISVATLVDTIGGKTQSTAIISVKSTASNPLDPIELKRSYIFAKNFGASMIVSSPEGGAEDEVRVSIIGENGLGLPASGVRSLSTTITLNEDLLHYLYAEGPNSVVKNGSTYSISHLTELQSQPSNALAVLVYKVYLTRDSSTEIMLTRVSLEENASAPCSPTVTGIGSATFNYQYQCGDGTIQRYLRNGLPPLRIISLIPNPARDECMVEFSSGSKETVTAEIYDVLGKLLGTIESVTSPLILHPNAFWAGDYILRLRCAGNVASARFVVVK